MKDVSQARRTRLVLRLITLFHSPSSTEIPSASAPGYSGEFDNDNISGEPEDDNTRPVTMMHDRMFRTEKTREC